jgi:hypothetical protein
MLASERLDWLAAAEAEAVARAGTGRDCGCAGCRSESERRPRGWLGWTPAVSLRQIDQARAALRQSGQVAPALSAFLSPGPRLFRISRAGIDSDRPLNIGLTEHRDSIAQRVADHYRRPGPGHSPVHRAIRNLGPGQILVQAGRLGRGDMKPGRARQYQGWLQNRERPLLLDSNAAIVGEGAAAPCGC